MNRPDETPIDFSAIPRLEPRPESFEEMKRRRNRAAHPPHVIAYPTEFTSSKTRLRWPQAIAALFIATIGLTAWLGVFRNAPPAVSATTLVADSMPMAEMNDSVSNVPIGEAVEWFGELGSGGSSTPLMVADILFNAF